MKNFLRYGLIIFIANIAAIALVFGLAMSDHDGYEGLSILIVGFIIYGLLLIIQVILGLAFSASEKRKDLGQGLLLGVGIIVLIGISICGTPLVFG